MHLFLESTNVPADRSAYEINQELVKSGARQVSKQYSDSGKVIGMSWVILVNEIPIKFSMPARIDGMYQLLLKRTPSANEQRLREKAERIAWRQLLAWVKIQNAMIQTGMAQAHEVFMPYACAAGSDRTMFEAWTAQLALPAPKSE